MMRKLSLILVLNLISYGSAIIGDKGIYRAALDRLTFSLHRSSSRSEWTLDHTFWSNNRASESPSIFPEVVNAEQIISSLRNVLDSYADDDSLCHNHSAHIIQGLKDKQRWAEQMIDAAGKPQARIMEGNLIWYGSYDECKKVKAVYSRDNLTTSRQVFSGQYCVASFPLTSFKAYNADLGEQTPSLRIALCLPSTCTDIHINTALWNFKNSSPYLTNISLPSVYCLGDVEVDGAFITAVIILGILAVLAIIATVYDLAVQCTEPKTTEKRSLLEPSIDERAHLIGESKKINDDHGKGQGTLSRLLLSFSLYTNARKLMSTKQTAGSLTAINGMRAISISWVVLGHTFIFLTTFASNFDIWLFEMLQRWSFQPINNALVCVDSFFAMSGLLLAYLTLKELEKRDGKLNIAMFYFHRFWRLTPAYMLLLLFDVGILKYLGDGPFWPRQGFEPNQCKDNWWWNILYLNNFLDNGSPSCFGWGWYLANDMQFFLISPLFLLPLYHNELVGVLLCCLSVVGTWIATGILSTHYGMPPSLFGGGGTPAFGNYYQWYYEKPFCRLGPYIVGILTGYALFKSRCRVKINKYLNLLTWAVATGLAVTILYGLRDPIVESPLSTQVSALYNTTHRTVWGACICWVIFACATGNGGPVNKLLSWPAFGPFARMSYCIYLIHPLVMYLYYGNLRELIYLADLTGIYLFLGNLVASCMAAFVASLLFEAPMLGLEKVVFRRDHK